MLRSMAVFSASSSVSFRARGLLTSRSVSALTGAVAAWSGLVVTVVVCADAIAAANAQTMISSRRTAVMQVLLDTPLLREIEVRVSSANQAQADVARRILLLTNTLGRAER